MFSHKKPPVKHNSGMVVIFLRTLITYITLVIVMRLMGKRQIGEMQPFEFIVTLIIADLACIPMADVSIPLAYGIVAILALFLLHQLFSILEQLGDGFKKALSGKPSIVIDKNGVCIAELKKNNMGVDDLIESMRALGYYSLDDLDYAIFESNGKLSPFERGGEDKGESVPLLIVNEGKIVKRNMKLINISDSDITAYIEQSGTTLKKTEVMTIDGNGRVYSKQKNKKYEITSLTLPAGVKW